MKKLVLILCLVSFGCMLSACPVHKGGHVPPGQAKKADGGHVPPGQSKKGGR